MKTIASYTSSSGQQYCFSNCTKEELENQLSLFFLSGGYSPVKMNDNKMVFEKKTSYWQILTGSLLNQQHSVIIQAEHENFSVRIHQNPAVLGSNLFSFLRGKKESRRIKSAFRNWFSEKAI